MVAGALTRQRAVERMFESIQQYRSLAWADSDDGPPDPNNSDEVMAFRMIDDAVREVNTLYDYHWNWIDEKTYTADGSGNVALAANVARVTYTDTERDAMPLQDRYAERDGFLYNVTQDTGNFGAGAAVRLKVTYWPEYQQLPSSVRHYVMWVATHRFVRSRKGVDGTSIQDIELERRKARTVMEKDQGIRQRRNILEGESGEIAARYMPPVYPM